MNTQRKIRSGWRVLVAVIAAVALLSTACGDDSESETLDVENETDSTDSGATVNACPEDGCTIAITAAEASDGELSLTWDANFAPELARNHIHVYWDNFEPAQVSGDAEARGVEQGDWVPTDVSPTFVTEGAVSLAERGDSTTVCVTAADGEHAVLDEALEQCFDISASLPS
jgi:hypothetical protein